MDEVEELRERVAELERLVLSLAEKLATASEHLGRVAEKREKGVGRGGD